MNISQTHLSPTMFSTQSKTYSIINSVIRVAVCKRFQLDQSQNCVVKS